MKSLTCLYNIQNRKSTTIRIGGGKDDHKVTVAGSEQVRAKLHMPYE